MQVLDVVHPVTDIRDTSKYTFDPFCKNTNVSFYHVQGSIQDFLLGGGGGGGGGAYL